MAEYTPEAIRRGWRLTHSDVVMEAADPGFDKGQIRAVLTISNNGSIAYRNRANLTSERARNKILSTLTEKGITLDERALIALEDACRKPRPTAHKNERDGGTDFSEKVTESLDLDGLKQVFSRHLLIADQALLPVTLGTILAHKLTGESVWLLIVAPPGGTKTEILRSFYGTRGMFALSELTPKTFASGLDKGAEDPSLLNRLKDEVLIVKDLTTVLEMPNEARSQIFAQLREIYDGRFDKSWGTGKTLHWQGRLGFIAGVTEVIDKHHGALAVLGERFVMLRAIMPPREELALRALQGARKEVLMRKELAEAMRNFILSRKIEPPEVPPEILQKLIAVTDFVTRARSATVRDGYRRELQYAPQAEAPTRFAKVLHSLACGIALAHDADEVTDDHLRYVMRTALDCLPKVRREVVGVLAKEAITDGGEGELKTGEVVEVTQFSSAAVRRALEDLQAFGIVSVTKGGQGRADTWALRDEWKNVFEQLGDAAVGTFPEKSEGVSQQKNEVADDVEAF